jgi:putative transcriptional regulator
MATQSIISTGNILLAEPFMQDPYFRRSVILLCEHHLHGSLGFILNKRIDMKVTDLLASFPEFDAEVYYGGPVSTDTLHYVHNVGEVLKDSVKVAEGIWMGGDFEQLKALVRNGLIEQHNIRFFIGYAGWSGGQLAEEMDIRSWIPAPVHANYVFKSNAEDLWSKVMYNKGDVFEVISDMPEFVTWN